MGRRKKKNRDSEKLDKVLLTTAVLNLLSNLVGLIIKLIECHGSSFESFTCIDSFIIIILTIISF